jgi:hypothetical protein
MYAKGGGEGNTGKQAVRWINLAYLVREWDGRGAVG